MTEVWAELSAYEGEFDLEKYISVLKKSIIFNGLSDEEIRATLIDLTPKKISYEKGNFIIRNGDIIKSFGIMISGKAIVIKEDFWGNRSVISELLSGDIFAETFACLKNSIAEISVEALEKTEVMFFNVEKILEGNIKSEDCQRKIIRNMLVNLAKKNLNFTRKIEHIKKKTIREKLLSYLSGESMKNNSLTFEIPFNRQQLADYLSVDRSALSTEIGKLQKDGIVKCKKNKFTLLQ